MYKLFIYFTIHRIPSCYSRFTALKFSIEVPEGFWEDLKEIFFKNRFRLFTGTNKILEYLSNKSRKNLSIVKKFGCVFAVNNFNLHSKNFV